MGFGPFAPSPAWRSPPLTEGPHQQHRKRSFACPGTRRQRGTPAAAPTRSAAECSPVPISHPHSCARPGRAAPGTHSPCPCRAPPLLCLGQVAQFGAGGATMRTQLLRVLQRAPGGAQGGRALGHGRAAACGAARAAAGKGVCDGVTPTFAGGVGPRKPLLSRSVARGGGCMRLLARDAPRMGRATCVLGLRDVRGITITPLQPAPRTRCTQRLPRPLPLPSHSSACPRAHRPRVPVHCFLQASPAMRPCRRCGPVWRPPRRAACLATRCRGECFRLASNCGPCRVGSTVC